MLHPVYTYESLAEELGMASQTLRLHVSQGRGPRPTYVGRLVRFTAESVAEWLAANTLPPPKRGRGRPSITRGGQQ